MDARRIDAPDPSPAHSSAAIHGASRFGDSPAASENLRCAPAPLRDHARTAPGSAASSRSHFLVLGRRRLQPTRSLTTADSRWGIDSSSFGHHGSGPGAVEVDVDVLISWGMC